jgi:hypothetical protein
VRLDHFGQVCMAAMNIPGTLSLKKQLFFDKFLEKELET